MKILYVIRDLNIAGAQRVVVDLACYSKKAGHSVGIATLYNEKAQNLVAEVLQEGIELFCYEKNGHSVLEKISRYSFLCRVIKEYSPSVIHGHLDYKYLWAYSLSHNRKIIETFHSQAYRLNSRSFRMLYGLLLKKKLIISVCLTENGAEEFCKLYNEKKENVFVIPNSLRQDWEGRTVEKNGLRDCIRFIFVARFHPVKNHELLVRAFGEYLKTNKGELYLVGEGETKAHIEKLCEELSIKDRVIMTGEQENVFELVSNSDIGVISSDSECFPLCLLECMYVGLPIIATNVGGVSSIVKGNGILVEKGNIKEFADAMIKMAMSKKMRIEMGKKSKKLVEEYNIVTVGNKYLELFELCEVE